MKTAKGIPRKRFKVPRARRDRRPRTRDYGYGNARTRGMKSRLLGAAFFEELMGVTDLGKMIQLLSETEYGPDLEAQLIRGTSTVVIDDALKDNMVRTFDKIMGFINDEARLLSKTLLGRWDLFNIKTIIRGKHMHLKTETIIDSLLPVGELTQVELKELAGLEDVLAVTDTLWTWGVAYSIPLRESMHEYLGEPEPGAELETELEAEPEAGEETAADSGDETGGETPTDAGPVSQPERTEEAPLDAEPEIGEETRSETGEEVPTDAVLVNLPEARQERDLSVLELALDKYYSQWAAKRLTRHRANYKLARLILGLQVDSTNLVTAFRLLRADTADMDAKRFFLPGGVHVSEKVFLDLTTLSDVDEVIDALKGTPYSAQLEKVLVAYLEANSIAVLERALEDYVMRRALGSGSGDPLGFGVMVSYLYAKQNEVTNLRIIVKGNSVGMPPDRMRKELIFV